MKEKKELWILFLIGLIIQLVLSELSIFNTDFHNFIYISFSLVLVLYGIFMRYIIKKLKIKSIFLTIVVATISLNIMSFIDFIIFPMLGGSTGQLYFILFIYVYYPISTILGIIYGVYIYKSNTSYR